jgi:hypothetical protein
MGWGGRRGSLPPRASRALAAVLVWVALLVLGAYALGLLTAWVVWGRSSCSSSAAASVS